MKRLAMITAVTLIGAATTFAADSPQPDYSQPAMLGFTREVLRERAAERVDYNLGAIDIYHFGARARLFWVPALAPLPGTKLNETAVVPNAFALTNTAIARSMPYMGDDDEGHSAAVNREMRRVLKMDKKRAKIKVTASTE